MVIQPFVGIGPVKFGMTPDEVRRSLGTAHESFMKTPTSSFPTDAFDDLGVFVYYDKQGKCEAVEVAEPGKALLGETDLLAMRYSEVEAMISSIDPEIEVDDDGFDSKVVGISAYCPNKEDDENAVCESILVFKEGYF